MMSLWTTGQFGCKPLQVCSGSRLCTSPRNPRRKVCSGGQLTASVSCLAKNLPYLRAPRVTVLDTDLFWLKSIAKALKLLEHLMNWTWVAFCEAAHLFLTANSYTLRSWATFQLLNDKWFYYINFIGRLTLCTPLLRIWFPPFREPNIFTRSLTCLGDSRLMGNQDDFSRKPLLEIRMILTSFTLQVLVFSRTFYKWS